LLFLNGLSLSSFSWFNKNLASRSNFNFCFGVVTFKSMALTLLPLERMWFCLYYIFYEERGQVGTKNTSFFNCS